MEPLNLTPEDVVALAVFFKELVKHFPVESALWILAAIVSKWGRNWSWIVNLLHAIAALLGGHA